MELGIDSFAAATLDEKTNKLQSGTDAIEDLIERALVSEKAGLDTFAVGEHHRPEYFDSANHVLLGAIAAKTLTIKLISAVTVLSAADPVRVFQNFATLDLLSKGRVELVAGRGSFSEAFPLFGYSFSDYDELFEEKLDLLLKIRDKENLNWKGKFRAPLINQTVYPRPFQKTLPIWRGVGGSAESFEKAGEKGLPLMVAIIGGETYRFKPLVDLYRKAYKKAGHPPESMKISMHAIGYLDQDGEKARDDFFPGHQRSFMKIGAERGWRPMSREDFDMQAAENGAYLIGSPKEIAEKIKNHSEALGGIDRVTFQMDTGLLPQEKLLNSIELIGKELKPLLGKN